jgi:hypothetical protein
VRRRKTKPKTKARLPAAAAGPAAHAAAIQRAGVALVDVCPDPAEAVRVCHALRRHRAGLPLVALPTYNVLVVSRRLGRGQLDHTLVQPQPLEGQQVTFDKERDTRGRGGRAVNVRLAG